MALMILAPHDGATVPADRSILAIARLLDEHGQPVMSAPIEWTSSDGAGFTTLTDTFGLAFADFGRTHVPLTISVRYNGQKASVSILSVQAQAEAALPADSGHIDLISEDGDPVSTVEWHYVTATVSNYSVATSAPVINWSSDSRDVQFSSKNGISGIHRDGRSSIEVLVPYSVDEVKTIITAKTSRYGNTPPMSNSIPLTFKRLPGSGQINIRLEEGADLVADVPYVLKGTYTFMDGRPMPEGAEVTWGSSGLLTFVSDTSYTDKDGSFASAVQGSYPGDGYQVEAQAHNPVVSGRDTDSLALAIKPSAEGQGTLTLSPPSQGTSLTAGVSYELQALYRVPGVFSTEGRTVTWTADPDDGRVTFSDNGISTVTPHQVAYICVTATSSENLNNVIIEATSPNPDAPGGRDRGLMILSFASAQVVGAGDIEITSHDGTHLTSGESHELCATYTLADSNPAPQGIPVDWSTVPQDDRIKFSAGSKTNAEGIAPVTVAVSKDVTIPKITIRACAYNSTTHKDDCGNLDVSFTPAAQGGTIDIKPDEDTTILTSGVKHPFTAHYRLADGTDAPEGKLSWSATAPAGVTVTFDPPVSLVEAGYSHTDVSVPSEVTAEGVEICAHAEAE